MCLCLLLQNHVVDLWSLFDFLMPGYLGTRATFTATTAVVQKSRHAKTSDEVHAQAAQALATLHKQVLPFVLRRLKAQVLKELPPKIIQVPRADAVATGWPPQLLHRSHLPACFGWPRTSCAT